MSLHVQPAYTPRVRARSLDAKPSSPHAFDDEFEGSVLDPKWSRTGTFDDVSAIDAYAGFTTGHRSSVNSYRKSWYMVQPSNAGSATIYQSGLTIPTDCFLWARLSFNFRYSGQTNNDHTVQISLGATSGGTPDNNNRAFICLNESDTNTVQAQGGIVNGGTNNDNVTGNVGAGVVGADCMCQPAQYVGIQKTGTTYVTWLGFENGSWVMVHTTTWAGTPTAIWVIFTNVSTSSPGNMVMGIDFLRFLSGTALP